MTAWVPTRKNVKMVKLTEKPSPITTETVALSGRRFSELRHVDGKIFYTCADPTKNKSFAAVESFATSSLSSDITPSVHTPATSNVRSAVHEYGGGSYLPFEINTGETKKEVIVFTDFANSHVLYASVSDGETSKDEVIQIYPPLSSENEEVKKNVRFADFEFDHNRNRLVCIMEDHTEPRPENVVNTIVSLSLSILIDEVYPKAKNEPLIEILAQGNDFYACPKLDPTGTKLAYITWNHPSMPWFVTELCVQELSSPAMGISCFGKPKVIHGCKEKELSDGGFSVAEPRWSKDSNLFFLSDNSGWYNLYKWDGTSDEATCIFEKEADFSSAGQGWVLGLSPYIVLEDGRILASYTNKEGAILVIVDIDGNIKEFSRTNIPPPAISSLCAENDSTIYFLGGSPTDPAAIWKWKLPSADEESGIANVAQKILPSLDPIKANLGSLEPFITKPNLISFPNKRGGMSYGYYYAPNNLSKDLPKDFKPPLLVKAHGGPTSQTSTTFRLALQYWTSRGFAILDVDYGGSTGYGRDYRLSLNKEWGIVDVDDVCSGALWCVDKGYADGDALCIDGGSAGGYTTLAALAFHDIFKCGASLYGVADLTALAADTHKFESRYLDILIGKYPEEEDIYNERAPINHIDKLSCPVILLQGDEDKIVPPNQAEMMYEALTAKKIPATLVRYDGEQHGFRMSYTVRHALNSEYSFFCKIFGFEAQTEGDLEDISIGERVEIKQK